MSSLNTDNKSKALITVLAGAFVILTIWWALPFVIDTENMPINIIEVFSGTYGILALFGGLVGIGAAQKWGGFKSILGRGILMLSLGLLAQEFGQLAFGYYLHIQHVEIPYPSLADVGYFGSILFYIYGAILIAKAAGATISLRSMKGKLIALLLPAAVLVTSYFVFLSNYEFDFSQPLTVFLDFGYPLGQAIYLSIALLAYLFSRKWLGGILKNKILLVIAAFFLQYAADFNFLYQVVNETWVNGGYGDYLYLFSYFVMGLALVNFYRAFMQIKGKS
jgi:hypothetical protein